jgi:hypothetical protein
LQRDYASALRDVWAHYAVDHSGASGAEATGAGAGAENLALPNPRSAAAARAALGRDFASQLSGAWAHCSDAGASGHSAAGTAAERGGAGHQAVPVRAPPADAAAILAAVPRAADDFEEALREVYADFFAPESEYKWVKTEVDDTPGSESAALAAGAAARTHLHPEFSFEGYWPAPALLGL